MSADRWLLVVHAAATVFMTGLIWVIQLVHYPLFANVGDAEFQAYERDHMRRIGWIVGPVMLAELFTAVGLLLRRPAGVDPLLVWAGFAMVVAIWASTAVIQGPTHVRLSRRKDEGLIRRLVVSNWLRTMLWSARGGVAMAMLVQGLRA